MKATPSMPKAAGVRRSLFHLALVLACTVLQSCGGGGGPGTGTGAQTTSSARILAELAGQQPLFAIAGSIGGPGYIDGAGPAARFRHPHGIAAGADGGLYVADSGSHVIRRIAPDGTVSTIAGKSGAPGSVDGPAAQARFSGLRYIAADAAGNLYVTDRHSVRRIGADGTVATLAGAADHPGSADGPGGAARFNHPAGIAADPAGNLYVADQDNHTLRHISSATGLVTTLAGTAGATGNADGAGIAARFNKPQGIALDAAGTVYVADRDNYTVRRIAADGTVSTVAGVPGISGSTDGASTAARFFAPQSIAVDAAGDLYVADAFLYPRMCLCGASGLIRRIALDGTVSTLAGTSKMSGSADGSGPAARFDYPLGIAAAADGNLYVSDTGNHIIRRVTRGGTVSTIAGSASVSGHADGPAASALFRNPIGIAADGNGSLYIADAVATPDESNAVIRKWSAGMISSHAGLPGAQGTGHADGPAGQARFSFPQSVAADGNGNVYVADTGNGVIRKIAPSGTVSTLAGQARSFGSVDGVGAAARFHGPAAIAVDALGNLYVADILQSLDGSHSATVRKVTPSGQVTTVAGMAGAGGDADGSGPAARFTQPLGIAVDRQGALYLADAERHTVRRITPDGKVVTLAGSAGASGNADGAGPAARFSGPRGVAIDAEGNVYIADTQNHLVRRMTPGGTVTTIAGTGGLAGILPGPLPGVLYQPLGIALVQDGILAITSGHGIIGLKFR